MRFAPLALVVLLAGCAHSPIDEPSDPLEPVNRVFFTFNEKVDQYVARPVAKGYVRAVPQPIRAGIGNFLRNVTYPTVIVNDVLQGKMVQAGQDTGRFLLNTTFGLAGFLDPATLVGLERHDEDFGQTFGKWGLGPGWYLMIPFLGPSTNRDLVGRAAGSFTNPISYTNSEVTVPYALAEAVDFRAGLLGAEKVLEQQFDRYIFVRGAYLQRRQNQVYDGNPPKEEIDFGEDE